MRYGYQISPWPRCGIGNQLLYYHNVRKKVIADGVVFACDPLPGSEKLFVSPIGTETHKDVTYSQIPFCLGERYYQTPVLPVSATMPNIINDPDEIQTHRRVISIHFRGGDYHHWMQGKAILDANNYYFPAIDSLSVGYKDKIIIHTNDHGLNSFRKVRKHFDDLGLNWSLGHSDPWHAMRQLAHSDVIISAPSTFSIMGGMLSRTLRDTVIIHNKGWAEWRAQENDEFWVNLWNDPDPTTGYTVDKWV